MKLLLAAVVICALAPLAHADRADQLFKQGKRLLAEKKYLEACAAFEESDRLDPGIGTKLNVAKCYEEWGKLATAWRWYSDAEHIAQAAKDDRAPRIHELAAALDASVPRLTVILPRGVRPDAVVVKLDGVVLAASALGSEQRVDPGPHQLDTIIDGDKQTKMVPIERGGSSEITLEASAAAAAGTTATPVGEPAESAPRDPGRNRRYIGLGVSGAGVLAVGIAGIVVLGAHGDYHDALSAHCNGASDQCDAEGLSATHSARHRANVATVVTLGGLAAMAGGAYLYFTAPKASHAGEHALYLAPSVGDATGVVLGGAF